MIKINLLPRYIVERRRVKAWALGFAVLLVLEALALAAYVWAPAPFSSLTASLDKMEKQTDAAATEAAKVDDLEDEINKIRARFGAKELWVNWEADANEVPAKWIDYLTTINESIPKDVVLNGLSLPSGNTLSLNGYTRDLMSAVRFYLNMLRCPVVQRDPYAVRFSPGVATPGDPMGMPVSITVALRPEVFDMLRLTVAPPAGVAGGGRAAARGRGMGRMGGGPRGGGMGRGGPRGGRGGGMRGGRGGRGGMMGGRGGRGGMMGGRGRGGG